MYICDTYPYIFSWSFLLNIRNNKIILFTVPRAFGSPKLEEVTLNGVEDAYNKHAKDGSESKGVKAHFKMDDSGILTLDKVEALFDKNVTLDDEEKDESTLSSMEMVYLDTNLKIQSNHWQYILELFYSVNETSPSQLLSHPSYIWIIIQYVYICL